MRLPIGTSKDAGHAADTYSKRLAKRRRIGKQWIYEPIAREFENG
jgi:hypothetical protein